MATYRIASSCCVGISFRFVALRNATTAEPATHMTTASSLDPVTFSPSSGTENMKTKTGALWCAGAQRDGHEQREVRSGYKKSTYAAYQACNGLGPPYLLVHTWYTAELPGTEVWASDKYHA